MRACQLGCSFPCGGSGPPGAGGARPRASPLEHLTSLDTGNISPGGKPGVGAEDLGTGASQPTRRKTKPRRTVEKVITSNVSSSAARLGKEHAAAVAVARPILQ